jgi:hypothetical protein
MELTKGLDSSPEMWPFPNARRLSNHHVDLETLCLENCFDLHLEVFVHSLSLIGNWAALSEARGQVVCLMT